MTRLRAATAVLLWPLASQAQPCEAVVLDFQLSPANRFVASLDARGGWRATDWKALERQRTDAIWRSSADPQMVCYLDRLAEARGRTQSGQTPARCTPDALRAAVLADPVMRACRPAAE